MALPPDEKGAPPAAPGGGTNTSPTAPRAGSRSEGGANVSTVWVQNAPFNANLYNSMTWLPSGSNFLRGCIESYPGTTNDARGGKRFRVNFLYNPTTISVSHSIDATVLPDKSQADEADKWKPLMSNQVIGTAAGNLTFSLLFDRTYETWGEKGKSPAGTNGVYEDVRALYRLTSMVPDRDQVGVELLADYMHAQLVTVYFGGILSPGSLAYYGVITDMEIDYTHWTYQMVPSRCVASLGMQLFPIPPDTHAATEYGQQPTVTTPSTPKASAPKGSSAATVKKGDGSLIRFGKPATTPGSILGGALGFRSK